MPKAKKQEIKDPALVAEILGHQEITSPDGEPVTTGEDQPEAVEQPAEVAEKPEDTSSEIELDEAQPEEPTQEKVQEEQRRTWQGERDKAVSEAERLRRENELKDAQLRAMQAANEQLTSVVQPFQQKYQQPEPAKQPKADFIVDGYFDQQKFDEYQQQRDQWIVEQTVQKATDSFSQKQEQQRIDEQLYEVGEKFPEYKNPLTGKVDVERLTRDVQGFTSKKSLIDIIGEMKGISPPNPVDRSIEAIQKNADRPDSVVKTKETEVTPKPVDPKLKKLGEAYGDLEYPEDFDGLE